MPNARHTTPIMIATSMLFSSKMASFCVVQETMASKATEPAI